jgi:NRPS condensation-like uncharacterized protein
MATKTKKWNQVFRASVVLKQDVQPLILAQAVADLKERFPTLYVQLKTGFLNYKLVEVMDTDVVSEEQDYPCMPVPVGSGQKPMFRVLYLKNRLSLEVFHAITDGGGALRFLKNIVARYLEILGVAFENTDGVVDYLEEPKAAEIEDSFKTLYSKDVKRLSRAEPPAYQYKAPFNDENLRVIHGLMPVDELKKLTKAKGVTITDYLTAVYIYAFYLDMLPNKSKKQIKISVPVELRRLFGFQTLRNCALYANIGINAHKKDYTFDEILAETVVKLKAGFDKETLRRVASTNAADANLAGFRYSPVFMKNFYLKIGFLLYGPRLVTTSFSNFGVVTAPAGIREHIDHFELMIGSTKNCVLNCGTVSFGNVLNVTFASISEVTNVQRLFFIFLSEQGVPITIQSNIQTEDL